jgi:hypothetical protein
MEIAHGADMLGRTTCSLLAIVAVAFIGCVAPNESFDESTGALSLNGQSENPDWQSPDEIARAREAVERDFADATDPSNVSPIEQQLILKRYAHLDPDHVVPKDLLKTAVTYFEKNKAGFPNQSYITVVDFKPRSDNYRFFLIKLDDGSVEKYHTTHGSGGDVDDDGIAESFGNVPNSRKSSLGFVRTGEVYMGTYQRAIRLDGLSRSNTAIRERFIVFHGWDKVHEANVIQGRSAGCITLDWAVKDGVLDKIKEGSLLYVGVSGSAANYSATHLK